MTISVSGILGADGKPITTGHSIHLHISEDAHDLTFEDISQERLKDLSDGELLAVYAAFLRTWERQADGGELPMGREQFVTRYQYVLDEFERRPELEKPGGGLDTMKEAFHLRGPHWVEIPEDGNCPVSHPNKDTSPDGKRKCYTNDAQAALRRSRARTTEQIEPPRNVRDLTVLETLQAVENLGRKFNKDEVNFQDKAPSPETVCGVCRFYLRDPGGTAIGGCQVVDGEIPWFSTSDLYISAEDEAEASLESASPV